MASEYLKWKYRDVKPEEPMVLTPAQKRSNWWHYHKWHVVLVAVLLLCAGDILFHALGVGQVKPDVQVAYVGSYALPEDTISSLEQSLSALATDGNGDGRTVVQVNQYAAARSKGETTEDRERAAYAEASRVALMADLESCDSFLFLLEDGETFQRDYQILAHTDGSLPAEGEAPSDRLWLEWVQCPVLRSLELGEYTETVVGTAVSGSGQELLSGLSIARRGFWTEKTCQNPETCESLWEVLTEGAQS